MNTMSTAYEKAIRISNVLEGCVRDVGINNHDENDAWVILDYISDMNLFDRIHETFERYGIEVYSLDDADTCIECHSLIEIQPSFNGWIPQFVSTEHGYVCNECVRKYPEDYIKDYIDNPDRAINFLNVEELIEMGWTLESDRNMAGMGNYATYDPADKVQSVREDNPDHEIILVLKGVGQFQSYYSVMIRSV